MAIDIAIAITVAMTVDNALADATAVVIVHLLKNSDILGKHQVEIETSFVTMSDPPTPNQEFLVQATTHQTLLTISYTLSTAHTTLLLCYFATLPAAVDLAIVLPQAMAIDIAIAKTVAMAVDNVVADATAVVIVQQRQ